MKDWYNSSARPWIASALFSERLARSHQRAFHELELISA